MWNLVRRIGVPGVVIVTLFVLIGLFAPLIAPYNPNAQDLLSANDAPSWAHWLGADHLGRDTLSRLILGARTTLVAVTIIVTFALCIGVVIGSISGFFGGWLDEIIMRFIDFGLAVPSLIVALAVIGALGPAYWNMVLALTIAWIPSYARLSRAAVASTAQRPHIESLKVLGASNSRILFRHLVPAAIASVLVYASADAGVLALAIATLSFLGLGVQPPTAEWGQMLVDALPFLEQFPLQVIIPGLALTAMVIGFNLLGEGLALIKAPKAIGRRELRHRRKLALEEARA